MIKLLGLAAFASLLAMPAAAQPLSPETSPTRFSRFIATSSLIDNPDKTISSGGLMGTLFFAGEVFGSDPRMSISPPQVKPKAQGLADDRVKALLTQCGGEMTDRGKEITRRRRATPGPSGANAVARADTV